MHGVDSSHDKWESYNNFLGTALVKHLRAVPYILEILESVFGLRLSVCDLHTKKNALENFFKIKSLLDTQILDWTTSGLWNNR